MRALEAVNKTNDSLIRTLGDRLAACDAQVTDPKCFSVFFPLSSGAGTNLKVEGTNFFVVPVHFFGSTNTISRFGERSRDGHFSLVSFSFAVLIITVPPVPSHL